MWLSKQWKMCVCVCVFNITELNRKSMPAKWGIDLLSCLKENQRNVGVCVSGEVGQTEDCGGERPGVRGSMCWFSEQVKLIIKQQHLADQPLRKAPSVCVRVCSAKRAVILVPGLCKKGQGKHLTGKR